MKKSILLILLALGPFSLKAEVCTGLHQCSLSFSLLENAEVEFDKKLNRDIISLGQNELEIKKETAKENFSKFLALNLLSMNEYKPKKYLITSQRDEVYSQAPFFIVTPGNIPPVFSKEGPVTLLYVAKKSYDDLKTRKINRLTKDSKIIENAEYKFIAISDSYEKASEAMELLMKEDK